MLLLLDSELVILRLGAGPMVWVVFFLKEQSFKGIRQKPKFPVTYKYMDFRIKMLAGAK